jgi:iron complex outermembrane receptor protein
VPRERFLGEPADGDVEVENRTHQVVAEYAMGADWTARLGLSRRDGTLRGFSTEASALLADGRTLRRQRRFRDYASDDLSLQAEVQGVVRTGALEHELLLGVEGYRFELDQRMLRINPTAANPYAIDLFAPVYGQPLPTPLPNTDTFEKQRNRAFYLQDSVRLSERWRAMAGVRVDRYQQTLDNRRSGVRTRQEPGETSPRLGLSYLPDPAWTLYANAGRSFRPNAGADAAGAAFEPERGRALEAGAKWERGDARIGATLALFDIRKRNVLTADPANPGFSRPSGEVRSRGVEFDLSGQITEAWRLNTSFVYDEVEILRDNTFQAGTSLINVPQVNGSVLAVREGTLPGGSRFGIGGGVTHMGERLGEGRTRTAVAAEQPAFMLPAYTTAKLVAYWRANDHLRVTLDVDNLFDETYYTSSVSPLWVAPGAGRSVVLGLQARF